MLFEAACDSLSKILQTFPPLNDTDVDALFAVTFRVQFITYIEYLSCLYNLVASVVRVVHNWFVTQPIMKST